MEKKEAIDRMKRALDEFVVEGVHTTIPFHRKMMVHSVFVDGDFNTSFLEKYSIMDNE